MLICWKSIGASKLRADFVNEALADMEDILYDFK